MPTVTPTGFVDPHGLGPVIERLGFQAKRAGKVALGIASALLNDGEIAELLLKGQFMGRHGVCILTNQRLLLVNDNEWKPDQAEIALEPDLTVQGWQDEKSAALIFRPGDGREIVIDRISDRDAAREMAQRVRSRVGG